LKDSFFGLTVASPVWVLFYKDKTDNNILTEYNIHQIALHMKNSVNNARTTVNSVQLKGVTAMLPKIYK
jgi:hypothetical protein